MPSSLGCTCTMIRTRSSSSQIRRSRLKLLVSTVVSMVVGVVVSMVVGMVVSMVVSMVVGVVVSMVVSAGNVRAWRSVAHELSIGGYATDRSAEARGE